MKLVFSFLLIGLFSSCSNYGQLTYITELPKKLDENSGIVFQKDGTLWVVEDNGNQDKIYKVNFKGQLIDERKISKAKNHDWEDLAKDEEGNLYIGDFGNNSNDRKNLVIYKIPNPDENPSEKLEAEAIRFRYPEQKKFPPKKEKRNFDAEAFFYAKDHLYIITKNRSRPFTGEAFVYRIPARKGNYEATLLGSFIPCKEENICVVTAADISPNGNKIALLGYGMLWVFTDYNLDDFTKGRLSSIDLGATTQLESICFQNDSTLLISDERSHGTGRNLYSFKLKN